MVLETLHSKNCLPLPKFMDVAATVNGDSTIEFVVSTVLCDVYLFFASFCTTFRRVNFLSLISRRSGEEDAMLTKNRLTHKYIPTSYLHISYIHAYIMVAYTSCIHHTPYIMKIEYLSAYINVNITYNNCK